MKKHTLLIILSACFSITAFADESQEAQQAQLPRNTVVEFQDADTAWAAIIAKNRRHPTTDGGVSSSLPQIRSVRTDWKALARQSREFIAKFPGNRHALEARKLELTAELVSIPRGSGSILPEIQARVLAYITNKSIPASDRFDISSMNKEARIVLRVGMSMEEITGKRLENARELATEFPSDPRSWASLLNAARRVSLRSAVEVVAQIVSSAEAPDDIKQGAQQLLDKYAMLGKPVSGIDLSSASGKPTLLYFWTLKQPPFIEFLKLCAEINGITLIGINIDENETPARKFAAGHFPPGEQFYEGADSPSAKRLHVDRFPATLVLDQNGILLDYPTSTYGAFDEMKQLAGTSSQAQEVNSTISVAIESK